MGAMLSVSLRTTDYVPDASYSFFWLRGLGMRLGSSGPSVVFLTLCLNVIFSLQVSQVLLVVVPLPVAGWHAVMLCCRSDMTTFLYVRESLSLEKIQTALELGYRPPQLSSMECKCSEKY